MIIIAIAFILLVGGIILLGIYGLGVSDSQYSAMGSRGKGMNNAEKVFFYEETKKK